MGGPGGDTRSLLEQSRKRIPGLQVQNSKPAQVVVKPNITLGPPGINDAPQSIGQPKTFSPLEVYLDLVELVDLNEVIEHGRIHL